MSDGPSEYHVETQRQLHEAQLVVATAAIAGAVAGMVKAAQDPATRDLARIAAAIRGLDDMERREGPAAVDAALLIQRAKRLP